MFAQICFTVTLMLAGCLGIHEVNNGMLPPITLVLWGLMIALPAILFILQNYERIVIERPSELNSLHRKALHYGDRENRRAIFQCDPSKGWTARWVENHKSVTREFANPSEAWMFQRARYIRTGRRDVELFEHR